MRRARREIRAELNTKWDEEGVRRPRLRNRLIVWGGAVFGIYLLLSGDTVERVIGVGLVVVPAVLVGIEVLVYWKGLRILRRARRGDTS